MSTHLILLCHAATPSMREGGFPAAGDPIDAGGLAKAIRADHRGEGRICLVSPALAARQTAHALGGNASVDAALRDIDHGAWSGLSFEQVRAGHAEAFANWLSHPQAGAPGGESLAGVRDRMATWLADRAGANVRLLAITHPMVIRAAIAAALDIPVEGVLRIDIAPLSATHLSWNGVWRLQAIEGARNGSSA